MRGADNAMSVQGRGGPGLAWDPDWQVPGSPAGAARVAGSAGLLAGLAEPAAAVHGWLPGATGPPEAAPAVGLGGWAGDLDKGTTFHHTKAAGLRGALCARGPIAVLPGCAQRGGVGRSSKLCTLPARSRLSLPFRSDPSRATHGHVAGPAGFMTLNPSPDLCPRWARPAQGRADSPVDNPEKRFCLLGRLLAPSRKQRLASLLVWRPWWRKGRGQEAATPSPAAPHGHSLTASQSSMVLAALNRSCLGNRWPAGELGEDAMTQSDEEQIVGAATWLLGGEGDPDAKAAWDLGAAGADMGAGGAVLTLPSCPAEKVSSLGKDWHRFCLRCEHCSKTLTPGGHAEHDGKPFCHKPCYATLFGPKGVNIGGAGSYIYEKPSAEKPQVTGPIEVPVARTEERKASGPPKGPSKGGGGLLLPDGNFLPSSQWGLLRAQLGPSSSVKLQWKLREGNAIFWEPFPQTREEGRLLCDCRLAGRVRGTGSPRGRIGGNLLGASASHSRGLAGEAAFRFLLAGEC
ncbi:PREDICTED: uncharacterized protein LOC104993803 [Bison bison bison]|uniref:Cysteine-rich protein 2 n=1 Tax=Bison bison bison TaxID=43346 RepID=A0A6P3HSC3_BISBB|nr:PREDICTED: uncharacterized protein LOC104993803 [Bison bison bison]